MQMVIFKLDLSSKQDHGVYVWEVAVFITDFTLNWKATVT